MAFLLTGERPRAAAFSLNPVRFFPVWFANARADYARHAALKSLLDLEDFRLDDLGLSRRDILAALHSPRPGADLAAVRARRARAWHHS